MEASPVNSRHIQRHMQESVIIIDLEHLSPRLAVVVFDHLAVHSLEECIIVHHVLFTFSFNLEQSSVKLLIEISHLLRLLLIQHEPVQRILACLLLLLFLLVLAEELLHELTCLHFEIRLLIE